MIDIIGARYGWSYKNITEEMYWEEFYEIYEHAYNMGTLEQNDTNHFQFIIHAQTKEAVNAWRDAPVPFPDRSWLPKKVRKKMPKVFEDKVKESKASPEQIARAKEVRERLAEFQREKDELGL